MFSKAPKIAGGGLGGFAPQGGFKGGLVSPPFYRDDSAT